MAHKHVLFRSEAREKIFTVHKMKSGTGNCGFDAAREEYCDLLEAGIIDPTKVVRVALENAVSVSSVLLLTEATLTEVPEHTADRKEAFEQLAQ